MSEKPETFSPGEWSILQSAMLRYRMRVQDRMADAGRSESDLLDLVRKTEARVNRLAEQSSRGIEATPVKPPRSDDAPHGEGGPGSFSYFSFAD